MATLHDDPVSDAYGGGGEGLPALHKELLHDSRNNEQLDAAIKRLIRPYLMATGRPQMHDVVLAPNTSVIGGGAELSGFVATVEGRALAVGTIVTEALGSGTTWFRVTGANGAKIDDDALAAAFKPLEYSHTGMRVSIVSGLEYPSTAHYVVVHGNDMGAARALVAKAAAAHATVEDVVKGELAAEYAALIKRSYSARTKTAAEFVRAHGLEMDGKAAPGNVQTHFIEHSHALSEKAQSSRVAASNVFVVYNNVIDPSEAHSGAMMYRGPIAGYTFIAGPKHTVKGTASAAWTNADVLPNVAHPFSMLPADTGLYIGAKSRRAPDRHKNTNERVREAHSRRVRWSGPVSSYNPLAEQIMHAPTDAHVIDTFSALGAPPGGAISMQLFDVVVTEVPGLITTNMSLDALVDIAEKSTEKSLPVNTGSFLRALAAWPDAPKQRLATLFASQHGDVVDVDVATLKTIHGALSASASSTRLLA